MIKKTAGGRYVLYSADGSRRLSKPGTLSQVKKREKQVQFFKNLNEIRKGGRLRLKKGR